VLILAFRRDELMSFRVKLQAAEKNICYLRFKTEAQAAQLQHRKAWLGMPESPP
jgi:predicted metalloprotease with PDZ domain